MVFIAESLKMALKMVKDSSTGLMVQAIEETSRKINVMEKAYLSQDKEVLKENGEMMRFKVLAILLLEIMESEDNGERINMKSQKNSID
jgi:hypothetical protein